MFISQFNIKKKTRVVESIEVTESGITFGPETGKETYPGGYASDGQMIMHVVIDLLPRIKDDQLTLNVMRSIEAIERGKPTQQQMQQVMDVYKAAEQAGIVQQYKDAVGNFVDQEEDDSEFNESEEGASADQIASSIANRFMNDRDLLSKVLKDSDIVTLTQAIDSVAEFHVGAQELGTSDVSGMVKEVMRELGINERKLSKPEQGVAEAGGLDNYRQRVQSQGFTDSPEERDADRLDRKRRHNAALDRIADIGGNSDEERAHRAQQRMARDEIKTDRMKKDDDDWENTFDMMRDRINRYQWSSQRDVDPEQLAAISNIKYEPKKKNEAVQAKTDDKLLAYYAQRKAEKQKTADRKENAKKESIDESILKEYEKAGYFTSAK